MAVIVNELTGDVLASCDDILEAEALIEVFEQVDPDGVHAGNYGIDYSMKEYHEYCKDRRC